MKHPGGRKRRVVVILAFLTLTEPYGCATLRQIGGLRHVDFSLVGTSGSTLGGVPIQSVRSLGDLSALQTASLASALVRGSLPFQTVFQVRATNPADNLQARLLKLDWTLYLDDQRTVSGEVDREYVLPPGESTTVSVPVQLDLLQFFHDQLLSLFDLALAAAGKGSPQRVRLEATPSIQTRLGPIRYPEPIRIERTVGG